MTAEFVLSELLSMANPEKAAFLQRFFKTGPGQYAEGDVFLGLVAPLTRSIAKANKQTPLAELQKLMDSEYHEARLCALLIAVEQFKKLRKLTGRSCTISISVMPAGSITGIWWMSPVRIWWGFTCWIKTVRGCMNWRKAIACGNNASRWFRR